MISRVNKKENEINQRDKLEKFRWRFFRSIPSWLQANIVTMGDGFGCRRTGRSMGLSRRKLRRNFLAGITPFRTTTVLNIGVITHLAQQRQMEQ